MIKSISHKGLRRFYEKDDQSKLDASMVEKIGNILADLDSAGDISDMDQPAYGLHKLKGDRKGEWSVTVRANWRITFRFDDSGASDVNLEDYH